jgi:hypothetical protein
MVCKFVGIAKTHAPTKYGLKIRKVAMDLAFLKLFRVENIVNSYLVVKFVNDSSTKSLILHVCYFLLVVHHK